MPPRYDWRDEPSATLPSPDHVVLSCFPSAGLAAIVAGHYIVQALSLPRVGTFDSEESPPLAIVQAGQVQPPIRVYGRSDLAVVVTEFPPFGGGEGALASAILAGATRLKARMVLAIEGVVPHPLPDDGATESTEVADEQVWAIPSRPDAALLERFAQAKARQLTDGIIGGVSGALLVRGQRATLPVAAMLVSARNTEGFPDHRAAASLIEALDRFLPSLKIDTGPLRSQAEMIERALRAAIKNQRPNAGAEPMTGPSRDAPAIYQ